jgi:hypothetical protein
MPPIVVGSTTRVAGCGEVIPGPPIADVRRAGGLQRQLGVLDLVAHHLVCLRHVQVASRLEHRGGNGLQLKGCDGVLAIDVVDVKVETAEIRALEEVGERTTPVERSVHAVGPDALAPRRYVLGVAVVDPVELDVVAQVFVAPEK